jgi:hypothetical protein
MTSYHSWASFGLYRCVNTTSKMENKCHKAIGFFIPEIEDVKM